LSPFSEVSFRWWFIIMNPGFIPCGNAGKKLFTLCSTAYASTCVHQLTISAPTWNTDSDIWESHGRCHVQIQC
jgi:hypothetical protein